MKEEARMKNLRKDTKTGLVLIAVWFVIKYLMAGKGLLLWLIGAIGLVMVIVGLLPEEMYQKVTELKNKLLDKQKWSKKD
jgi:hypothetical protein